MNRVFGQRPPRTLGVTLTPLARASPVLRFKGHTFFYNGYTLDGQAVQVACPWDVLCDLEFR